MRLRLSGHRQNWVPVLALWVGLAAAAAACGPPATTPSTATEAPTEPEAPAETQAAAACPAVPEEWTRDGFGAIWPAEGTEGMVPELPGGMCTTPTAPVLLGVLNEDAAMFSSTEAAAFGVMHRHDDALATFAVVRVAADTPGLDDGMPAGGAAVTQVDGLELLWGMSGSHVMVVWLDDRDLVSLSAANVEAATEAASSWLSEQLLPPSEIPAMSELEPALAAGLPVDDLPEGYVVLPINPAAFEGSDLADSVTIHDAALEALGGAIVLRDSTIVGTVLGATGDRAGMGTRPLEIGAELERAPQPGVALETISEGDTDIVIVGSDKSGVRALAKAWSASLKDT